MTMPGSGNEMGHTDSASIHRRLQEGEDLQILDVREPWEHAQGIIEGATILPLAQVHTRWQELDPARPVYVICHLGSRSARAAAFLAGQGLQASNIDDGMDGWTRQGFPTVK
ncbi:MAG TPA: rhodanese-like domain-containing protein [Chloroflexota bacterium]|nr:rhodanese-like domain-containing protein [Chloroflexota bacterium]